jgi:hypothetical protein
VEFEKFFNVFNHTVSYLNFWDNNSSPLLVSSSTKKT